MTAPKAKGRDDLVMGTNSSSIVSKRSVERIYFPNEPQYYRYFVKKFQRRAPLINRGYHLRLHLIDTTIRDFLTSASSTTKVVVNLGCGSDVLPWQSMYRYPEACRNAIFVDIDFPDLMALKKRIVQETPELRDSLTDIEFPQGSRVLLRSKQYYQIGCDLRQLDGVSSALESIVSASDAEFLFVAEVSITYMDPDHADDLIRWASTMKKAEFCLLEQILPEGPKHPFAQTMLQHFDKLNTPIKCVHKYSTQSAQQQRFQDLGWPEVRSWTLWQAWSDPLFFSASDRQKLDEMEVFDEWEEFAHFGNHYLYLRASTPKLKGNTVEIPTQDGTLEVAFSASSSSQTPSFGFSASGTQKLLGARRFASALMVRDALGQRMLANYLGLGTEGRHRSFDIYKSSQNQDAVASVPVNMQRGGPTARMCHTLTDMGDLGYLLVGGRTSPTGPFRDGWIFKKDTGSWKKTHDLPVPLYRHSVTRLGHSSLALLAGGKSGSHAVFPGYLVFHPNNGWTSCKVTGPIQMPPSFGALLFCIDEEMNHGRTFHGILAGGMTADAVVHERAVRWTLDISDMLEPSISFEPIAMDEHALPFLYRFGACCTRVDDWTVILGGVTARSTVLQSHDIILYRIDSGGNTHTRCLTSAALAQESVPPPVLVGASAIATGQGELAILGGGMTCFSMGTVWSRGVYTFNTRHLFASESKAAKRDGPKQTWKYWKTMTIANDDTNNSNVYATAVRPPDIVPIARIKAESAEQFKRVMEGGKPAVLEGFDLGSCTSNWNTEYLTEKVGADRKVVVHESSSAAMDFISKNFHYTTQKFGEFMRQISKGKKLYLRALSTDEPSDKPARLHVDFPALSGDFSLPPSLAFVSERLFSSVLRVSGPVNMWLHYDVLANVYCQISGSKRFYVFPPADVTQLGFSPGASSSSVDVFSAIASSSLPPSHPHEVVVGPGDVLFLPPLWLHTAMPISTTSVAVNVFFRDLDSGYSAGRDVYGNRDLAAYEKARLDISRISKSFSNLPRDAQEFYLCRLADELLQMALE